MKSRRPSAESLLLMLVMVAGIALAVHAGGRHMAHPAWVSTGDKDSDRDGIPDLFDLCPDRNSLGRPDRDGDGIRDPCDLSPAGDGTLHIVYGNRTYIMDGRPEDPLAIALLDP